MRNQSDISGLSGSISNFKVITHFSMMQEGRKMKKLEKVRKVMLKIGDFEALR